VFGSILFRMIFWELAKVFLMALIGITGILLMAGIIAEATQQGLGPTQILAAIPLLIPSTLPYTIPATTLFAACVVYGRLAADNEILAIKAAGVNIFTAVRPGLVLGLAMSTCTMGLYYHIIPYTHFLLRSMVFSDAEELMYSLLRKQNMINHPNLSYSMFVKGVQGHKLLSPIFKRRNDQNGTDVVAQAREAVLWVNMAKRLVYVHMRYGVASMEDGSRFDFVDRVWEVPLPDDWKAETNKRPRAMTWVELSRRRENFLSDLAEAEKSLAALDQEDARTPATPERTELHHNLKERARVIRQQCVELKVEMLMRPALSLGCFFFILVGCPVGIWFSRSDFLSSFITCFLPIVIVYYPLVLCGTNMAKEGRLSPEPLVWAANAVVGTIGLVLFARLTRN
jgi:lipopolysaccharide export system permease protein